MLDMNDGGYKPFDPTTLAAFGDNYRTIVAKLQQTLPSVRLTFIRSSPFDDVSKPPQFAPTATTTRSAASAATSRPWARWRRRRSRTSAIR
jgi:hypothetical protein